MFRQPSATLRLTTDRGRTQNRTLYSPKSDEAGGLRAIAPKRFKPQTTDPRHGLPIAANLLQNGAIVPICKGAVVVGDITYLRLRDGKFCYLARVAG